ncbi:ParA family protein [Kitasatospora sp. NPDC036755]|uniref:ParA family protein n=1 Tax=Kitasatospora sp. NPDC036755 TaxID=3154600 RepID=UPI0033F96EFA
MALALRAPRRVAVIARKGGVGKTTTTVQLAMALAVIYQIRVLVVDHDPQGNATARLGVKEGEPARTLNDVYTWVLSSEHGIAPAIHPTPWPGVYVVAAEESLKSREPEGEHLVHHRLRLAFERSDAELAELGIGAVLIDTPPGTGALLLNAILGAHAVVVVTDPEPDGLTGAHKAVQAAQSIKATQHPDLELLGIIVNRFDPAIGEHGRCCADLVAAHGDLVWTPWVSERASVKTARGLKRPVQEIRDNGGRAYVRQLNNHARRLGAALGLKES